MIKQIQQRFCGHILHKSADLEDLPDSTSLNTILEIFIIRKVVKLKHTQRIVAT